MERSDFSFRVVGHVKADMEDALAQGNNFRAKQLLRFLAALAAVNVVPGVWMVNVFSALVEKAISVASAGEGRAPVRCMLLPRALRGAAYAAKRLMAHAERPCMLRQLSLWRWRTLQPATRLQRARAAAVHGRRGPKRCQLAAMDGLPGLHGAGGAAVVRARAVRPGMRAGTEVALGARTGAPLCVRCGAPRIHTPAPRCVRGV